MADSKLSLDDLLNITGIVPQSGQPAPEGQGEIPGPLDLDFMGIAATPTVERDPAFMSEDEKLLREGDAATLERKYGPDAALQMLQQFSAAGQQVHEKRTAYRTFGEKVGDGITDFVAAPIYGTMNLATLLGKGTDELGVTDGSAVRLAQATQQMQRNQAANASEGWRQAQEVAEIRKNVLFEQNAQQAKIEREQGDSEIGTAAKRLLMDAADAVKVVGDSPTNLGSGLISGAGSMLGASQLSGALNNFGKGVINATVNTAAKEAAKKVVGATAAKSVTAASLSELGSWMTASALMEGGGAFQQTVNEVMSRPVEALRETSKPFQEKTAELMLAGMPQEEAELKAREWLASEAAGSVGLATGAVAALLAIPAKGSANPLKGAASLRAFAGEVIGEGVEEFGVNLAAQTFQNAAIRDQVDPSQDIWKGVGGSGGEALLIGGLSGGAMKGPGTMVELGQTANDVRSKFVKQPQPKGQALSENLGQQADVLFQDRDTRTKLRNAVGTKLAENPETNAVASESFKELISAPVVSALPDSHALLSPEKQTQFNMGQNRVRAIETASQLLMTEKNPAEKQSLAIFLSDLMSPIAKFQETPSELESVMADPELGKSLEGYQKLLSGISQLPLVQEAQTEMLKVFESLDESLDTMAPEQAAQVLGAQAMLDPNLSEKVTSTQVRSALLENKGRSLTPEQRLSLKGSEAIILAREAKLKERGIANPRVIAKHLDKSPNEVASEVTTSADPSALETGKYSARQHTSRIVKAMRSGKTDLAKGLIQEFAEFVQHMQNKAQALDQSRMGGGTKVPYQQRVISKDGTSSWASSETNPNQKHKFAFFNAKSENSIAHAQEVDAEASLLSDLLKNLVKAYPELELKKMPEPRRIASSIRNTEPKELVAKLANPAPKAEKPAKKQEKPQPTSEAAKVTEVLSKAAEVVPGFEKVEITGAKPAPQSAPKNEVKAKPKNVVKAKAEVKETEPEPKGALAKLKQAFKKIGMKERARTIGIDSLSGLRSREAWDEAKKPAGSRVLIVTSAAVKAINDDLEGGHDTTNELLRVMGKTVGKIDPTAARSGTNFLITIGKDENASEILYEIKQAMPDQGLEIVGVVGTDVDKAFKRLDKLTDKMRKVGQLPARGKTGFDLKKLKDLVFPKGMAKENLAQETVARVSKMSDDEYTKHALEDRNVPGLMNGIAWKLILRKAWVASIDLKGLKKWNESQGKDFGDKLLKAFGQAGLEFQGLDFDFAHLSGDEYAAQADSKEALEAWLEKLKTVLQDVGIPATLDGEQILITPEFRSNTGKTYGEADKNLNAAKQLELAAAAKNDNQRTEQAPGAESRGEVRAAGSDVQGRAADVEGRRSDSSGTGQTDAGNREGQQQEVAPKAESKGKKSAPKKLADFFPALFQTDKIRNFFAQGYQLASAPKGALPTRVMGKENPIGVVRDATNAENALKDHLGKDPRSKLTPAVIEAFQKLLEVSEDAPKLMKAWKKAFAKANAHLTGKPRRSEFKFPKVEHGTQTVGDVMAMVEVNLNEFLDSRYSEGVTFRQAIEQGTVEATVMQRGKVLNVTEKGPDGELRYNPELLQQATLAAFQWQISGSQRQVTKKEDDIAEDLTQDLGIAVDGEAISDKLVRLLSQGENLQQAKKSLANTIQRFWGVQSVETQAMGLNEAIHEAMAGEMLRAMSDLGLVKVDEVNLFDIQPSLGIKQTVDRYIPTNWTSDGSEEQSPIYAYPELLEEAVVTEPEHRTFYGKEVPKVRGTQLGNDNVELTTQQHLAVTNMQKQPYKLNIPMMKALVKLTSDQIIELFGHVLPTDEAERNAKYNKNHLSSLEGKNLSVLGAFAEMQRLVAEMEGVAEAQQIPLEALEKRYQYAITSMNRVMMLGAHNPQASKLMREIMMPTWSTLDLSDENGEHYQHLKLAVAQALGRKIYQFSLAENVKWVETALNGGNAENKIPNLTPAREVIQTWLKNKSEPFPVSSFKAAVGDTVEVSPLMMAALMENERAASSKDKKNFKTPLYLEADGMTNGPFNSIGLLSTGPFSEEQLRSMKRGGLNVGTGAKKAHELRAEVDNRDIYRAGTDATQRHVAAQGIKIYSQGYFAQKLLKKLGKSDWRAERDVQSARDVLTVRHNLLAAMSHLFSGDLKWTEKNGKWELELERGIGKNPITILVYGSSTNGIAGNFAYKMETAFYEKLTALKQSRTAVEPELLEAMNLITSKVAVHLEKDDRFFIAKDPGTPAIDRALKNPESFTFTPEERARMQQNLHTLFVKPMEKGIREVIGESVFATRDLLVKATSLQSTMARELFLKSIAQKMADKEDARAKSYEASGLDPKAAAKKAKSEVTSEFLSREELSAAWDELRDVMPVVESDGQHFLIAKNALLAFFTEAGKREARWQYSRSLNDDYRTAPYVTGIGGAGVSAVPYLTIGMGDARMVRKIFETAFENAMQVYDGVNIPIDRITEYGKRINKAALESWQGDVLSSVSLTFEKFLNAPETQKALRDPKLIEKLQDEKIDVREAGQTSFELKEKARSQRARKAALSKAPISMDQMAGAYSPHTTKGELQIPEGASVADIKALLDVEYAKALQEELARESGAKADVQKRIQPQIRRAPGNAPSGRVTVAEMLRTLELSPEQRQVLTNLVRSGALENVKMVTGTLENLIKHQIANFGASSIAENLGDRVVGGLYSPTENTVYLLNPTPEVVVHELIHAATYQAVEAHYGGLKMGREGTRVKAAVQRLEQLMNIFLAQESTETEGALIEANIEHLKAVIQDHLAAGDVVGKAAALNEFMSYALSNQDLIEEFSKRSLGKQLAKLVKATVQAMVRLIWRTEHSTAKQMDFLKAVRFNTYALAHAQSRFSLKEELQGILVAHETIAGTEDTRLQDLLETFSRKVADNLEQNYSANQLEHLKGTEKTEDYADLVEDLTYAADYLFQMSSEEQQVFHMMVAAFATEGQINPHAMIEGQKIFDHFLKNLKQADFLTGHRDAAYDADQARDKFEFLSGHTLRISDSKDRSSVLPVFMALAMTSENFRKVLAEKNMPSEKGQPITGLDSALEAVGSKWLSNVEDMLSGTNQPENVKAAIHQLMGKMVRDTLKSRSVIEDKLEAMNKGTNGINARMVHLMQRLGSASYQKGQTLQQSNSEFDRKLGTALKAISFISSERDAKVIEEGILKFFDQHPKTWEWVKDLVGDLIGRVASQGAVYDLLKKARTMTSQSRQAFRDNVPAIILELFKQNKPSVTQLDSFYTVMGRYDMASLLTGSRTVEDVLTLASDRQVLAQEVAQLEHSLQVNYPFQASQYQAKIDQLVKFIQTGVRGPALLRNAHAIAELLGQEKNENWTAPDESTVQMIDQLVTLKLLAQSNPNDLSTLAEFVRDEPTAMQFMLNYLKGQRATELTKAETGLAKFNHYKGELPSDNQAAGHIVVAPDDEHESMVARGYKLVGTYNGSSLERGTGSKKAAQSYYFSPDASSRAAFAQGIAQNVQQTAYGVHTNTGRTLGPTAGGITDKTLVAHLAKKMNSEAPGPENLSPVFGLKGQVIAFERSLDPARMKEIQRPQNLAAMLGRWRGRQAEEVWGTKINEELMDALVQMYAEDGSTERDRYVNLFASTDPVIQDAVSILPFELRELAEQRFGKGQFYVRRNLVNQVVGYRNASVTDLWTGNTRWSKNTQEIIQKSLMHLMGTDAYRILSNGERNVQAVMASVRTNIVVRSLIVPTANFVAGVFQLSARGVSLVTVAKGVPAKVAEIEFFTKTVREKIQLEAERWASEHDVQKTRAIDARLQVMEDSLRHLSIWPLIEAGEFSTIADVGQTAEELGIGPNNIMDKLTQAVDKLPGGLREAAKVGYVARDTALFQALQKSVQYSDFVMKAIYFDHLTKEQKMPPAAAKALVTEEFVNYDLLPGRNRAYLENVGLAWFMNFKIRSSKIALSMIRNNPFNLLVFSVMPHPFGADIPVTGNILSKLFDGLLGFSIGPRMAFQSIAVSPWYNLIAD